MGGSACACVGACFECFMGRYVRRFHLDGTVSRWMLFARNHVCAPVVFVCALGPWEQVEKNSRNFAIIYQFAVGVGLCDRVLYSAGHGMREQR